MSRIFRIFRNSLAVLSLAGVLAPAVASASPFHNVFRLHSYPVADHRVSFTMVNKADIFRDVRLAGRTYTVLPHHTLQIKAPVGTRIYAASTMFSHTRGSVLLEVTPAIENQKISFQ